MAHLRGDAPILTERRARRQGPIRGATAADRPVPSAEQTGTDGLLPRRQGGSLRRTVPADGPAGVRRRHPVQPHVLASGIALALIGPWGLARHRWEQVAVVSAQPAMLLTATALSVFKPGGRIAWHRSSRRRASDGTEATRGGPA